MDTGTITVTEDASLWQLLRKTSQGQIVLRLDGLTPLEADYWEHRLNSLYSDCGCSMGTLFMGVSVGLYVTFLLLDVGGISWSVLTEVLVGVLVVFAGSGIGKAVGLQRAKYQLKKTIDQINAILVQRKTSSANP